MVYIFLLLSSLASVQATAIETSVRCASTKMHGLEIKEREFTYKIFKGIPYAKPPLHELRFMAPVLNKLEKELNATQFGSACLQYDLRQRGKLLGDEDCLFLNIYTPNIVSSERFPVLIWIHGGAFTQGFSQQFSPSKLVKEGTIVVTINYRLGGLGFLSFENNIVSGNMGLKDQSVAVEWVREHIECFNGDPERVTLGGQSAGGMSVHTHILSPWSKGKISGGIAMSGTMLLPGVRLPGDEGNKAKTLSSFLNCSSSLGDTTLSCLQKVDSKALANNMNKITLDIG